MTRMLTALVVFSFANVPAVLAQTPLPLTVSGSQATARIELPGGVSADLTLSFEQVVGLNPAALEVTASLVSPLDPSLLSRLPVGGGVAVPAAFPVLIRIEPSAASALSFAGIRVVSVHTENLSLTTNSPLGLYSGSAGGPLHDTTREVGMGSYRAGGSGGTFSDFLIVADTRLIDEIMGEKFGALQTLLDENVGSMPAEVAADLQTRLSRARTLFATGATLAAKAEVSGFADAVKSQSGTAIPDVWRAHDGLVNVAGLLRGGAETLRFSLDKKANGSP